MGKQFQMLEDLERIIEAGYGEEASEPEEIEEAVNPQKLKMLFTSLLSSSKEGLGRLKDKDVTEAIRVLAFMPEAINQSLRDPAVKKYANELKWAILGLAGEDKNAAPMESKESEDSDE